MYARIASRSQTTESIKDMFGALLWDGENVTVSKGCW